jgi:UDP-N-acetyl-D-galactosamine dehydrogenase
VILAGRRINDRMGSYVADRVARLMMARGLPVVGSRILVLGLAFKENCPDLRNSKVLDVIATLREYNAVIEVWDPQIDIAEARRELTLEIHQSAPPAASYDAVILAVGHRDFAALGPEKIRAFGRNGAIFFDVKGVFAKHESDGRL